jgi:hypothetical protein
MSDARDLSGVWYGRYRSAYEENSFIALLEEGEDGFSGSISEPDPSDLEGTRRAVVAGIRTGSRVRFVKQYRWPWSHAVNYSGELDPEGTSITGRWNVYGVHGSFVMQRDKFSAEAIEDEDEIELLQRR